MGSPWFIVSVFLLLAFLTKERFTTMSFNVNAARESRLLKNGALFDFEIDGDHFKIPTELPVDKMEILADQDGSLRDLFGVLLEGGDEARDKLFAHELSGQDCKAILDEYAKVTGASLPEESAS